MSSISALLNHAAYALEDYAQKPDDSAAKWAFFHALSPSFEHIGQNETAQKAVMHLIHESAKLDAGQAYNTLSQILYARPRLRGIIFEAIDQLIAKDPLHEQHAAFKRHQSWNDLTAYVIKKHSGFAAGNLTLKNAGLFLEVAYNIMDGAPEDLQTLWADDVAQVYHTILTDAQYSKDMRRHVVHRVGTNPILNRAIDIRYPDFATRAYAPAAQEAVFDGNTTAYNQIYAFQSLLHDHHATSPVKDVLVAIYQRIVKEAGPEATANALINLNNYHFVSELHNAIFADYTRLSAEDGTQETCHVSEAYPVRLAQHHLNLVTHDREDKGLIDDKTIQDLQNAMALTQALDDPKRGAAIRFEIYRLAHGRTNNAGRIKLGAILYGDVLEKPLDDVLAFQESLGGYAPQAQEALALLLLYRSPNILKTLDVFAQVYPLDKLDADGIATVVGTLGKLAAKDANKAFEYFKQLNELAIDSNKPTLVSGLVQAFAPYLDQLSPKITSEAVVYLSKHLDLRTHANEMIESFIKAHSQDITRKHKAFSVKVKAP